MPDSVIDEVFKDLPEVPEEAINFIAQVAMFLTRELTASSFTEIGHNFNDMHHSTVMNTFTLRDRSSPALLKSIECNRPFPADAVGSVITWDNKFWRRYPQEIPPLSRIMVIHELSSTGPVKTRKPSNTTRHPRSAAKQVRECPHDLCLEGRRTHV